MLLMYAICMYKIRSIASIWSNFVHAMRLRVAHLSLFIFWPYLQFFILYLYIYYISIFPYNAPMIDSALGWSGKTSTHRFLRCFAASSIHTLTILVQKEDAFKWCTYSLSSRLTGETFKSYSDIITIASEVFIKWILLTSFAGNLDRFCIWNVFPLVKKWKGLFVTVRCWYRKHDVSFYRRCYDGAGGQNRRCGAIQTDLQVFRPKRADEVHAWVGRCALCGHTSVRSFSVP